MFFQHIFESSLAHASYLIGCQAKGVAIVIDPKRDVDTYLAIAEKNNLKITHIAETHIHADYLSGSLELAALTGAKLYLSDEGGADWQYDFDHVGLKHQDEIKIGNLIFKVLHTPGHTAGHFAYLYNDRVFTGDALLIEGCGRTDFQHGDSDALYHSVRQKLFSLPDETLVYPAHDYKERFVSSIAQDELRNHPGGYRHEQIIRSVLNPVVAPWGR